MNVVTNRYRFWSLVACATLAAGSLGFAPVAGWILNRGDAPWYVLCGIVGLEWTILLAVAGKRFDRQCRALMKGKNLLAIWTFEADEWQRYQESQRQHERKSSARVILVLCAFCVVTSAAWALLTGDTFRDLFSVRFVKACLLFCGYVVLFIGPPFICFKSIHRTRMSIPRSVLVGRNASWVEGVYWTWADKEDTHFLREVEFVKGDPSELRVCFDVIKPRRSERITVQIPVPRKSEGEAQALLSILRADVWTNEEMPW